MESTQWLNLTNCGVVRVKSGSVTLAELEGELSEIIARTGLGRLGNWSLVTFWSCSHLTRECLISKITLPST